MPSPATSNTDASVARHAWLATLLGSALAGCAGLGSEAEQPAPAPHAAVPPTQAPAAPAAAAPAQNAPAAVPAPTSAAKPALGAEQGARFEGFISSRLVERWTSGDHDLDWINLSVTCEPAKTLRNHRQTG